MMKRHTCLVMAAALLLISGTGCAAGATASKASVSGADQTHKSSHSEPRPFNRARDARMDVDQVLADAKQFDKLGLIVMGANWCHDSRALAAHFETPRFQSLIRSHYKLTYVDVGQKNRNLDIARGFGLDTIVGTPTVFVTNSDGEVLNLDTAPTWRNAASRTEDDIWRYFRDFAHKDGAVRDNASAPKP